MTSPRIIILVLSCHKPPYQAMYETQRETWDSIKAEGVITAYYWCNKIEEMPGKLKLALGAIQPLPWEFVFRTNSSSYVDKARLQEFAETLPTEKCYCGIDGGGFASGSGFFMSRDVVETVTDILPDKSVELVEDELIGMYLYGRGITVTPGARRYDYWTHGEVPEKIRAAYHVRCKGSDVNREDDVIAMQSVHGIKNTR